MKTSVKVKYFKYYRQTESKALETVFYKSFRIVLLKLEELPQMYMWEILQKMKDNKTKESEIVFYIGDTLKKKGKEF